MSDAETPRDLGRRESEGQSGALEVRDSDGAHANSLMP